MKKIILILAFLSGFSAFAQTTLPSYGPIQGQCSLGGTQAKLSGLLSTNYLQGIIPSCTVTVYLTGTQTLATIYKDASKTALSNPFTANTAASLNPGGWIFYALQAQGYDVQLSGGIAPNVYFAPITLNALFPYGGGSGSGGGGSGVANPIITFTNSTSVTMSYLAYNFMYQGILTACYDTNGNKIETQNTDVTLAGINEYNILFTFAVAQSGYCTANSYSSGTGGAPVFQTPNVIYKGNGSSPALPSSLSDSGSQIVAAENAQFNQMLTSAIDNGVINPTLYPGTDLAQQIASAIATACTASVDIPFGPYGPGCTLKVPPGLYVITSGQIFIPSTGANLALLMDGVTLQFTGANITGGIEFAPGSDHVFLHGGMLDFLYAETSCKSGIRLDAGIQGAYIDGVRETRCRNGDGLVNFGANVVKVGNSTFASNLIGVHLLGSPGYASNANTFTGNIITGNARQAIIVGDITQYPVGWPYVNGAVTTVPGSSSPMFNNLFIGNDLEGNGSSSTSSVYYPAVLDVLTFGDVYEGNYFEATPYRQFVLGSLGNTDPAYTFLYGPNINGPQGGTSSGAQILRNYFTTSGGQEIELAHANNTVVDGNSDSFSVQNTCFINISNVELGGFYNNNNYQATSRYCYAGAPVSDGYFAAITGPDTIESSLAITGPALFFNGIKGGDYVHGGFPSISYVLGGPPVPSNPNNVGANPNCDPSYGNGSIMIDTCKAGATGCNTGGGVEWLCVDDTRLSTPINDGHSRWVLK